jgi:hypothetical protein
MPRKFRNDKIGSSIHYVRNWGDKYLACGWKTDAAQKVSTKPNKATCPDCRLAVLRGEDHITTAIERIYQHRLSMMNDIREFCSIHNISPTRTTVAQLLTALEISDV